MTNPINIAPLSQAQLHKLANLDLLGVEVGRVVVPEGAMSEVNLDSSMLGLSGVAREHSLVGLRIDDRRSSLPNVVLEEEQIGLQALVEASEVLNPLLVHALVLLQERNEVSIWVIVYQFMVRRAEEHQVTEVFY